MTSTKLTRKGTRQPQLAKDCSLMTALMSLIIAVESSRPIGTPSCGQLAIRPRRLRLPHSMLMRTEPPHSPPTPMPWARRSTVRMMGAATPIVEAVGSTPIRNVAVPMRSRVVTSVALRPTRSPMCPKIAAPTGRAAKPTNSVLNDKRVPLSCELLGKNRWGKTRAAAVP